jgi:hypothetical protein
VVGPQEARLYRPYKTRVCYTGCCFQGVTALALIFLWKPWVFAINFNNDVAGRSPYDAGAATTGAPPEAAEGPRPKTPDAAETPGCITGASSASKDSLSCSIFASATSSVSDGSPITGVGRRQQVGLYSQNSGLPARVMPNSKYKRTATKRLVLSDNSRCKTRLYTKKNTHLRYNLYTADDVSLTPNADE